GPPALLVAWLAALAPLYPPLSLLRWGARWGDRPPLAGDLRTARTLLGALAAALGGATVALAWDALRGLTETGDTHGSSRGATPRDLAAAALPDPPPPAPPPLAPGVVLGGWRDPRGRLHRLRDRSDRHVLAFAPTGSGKSTSLMIPTLLEWPGSVLVLDVKG